MNEITHHIETIDQTEDNVGSMPAITPGPRDITKLSRVEVFRELAKALPRNDYGLPKYLYRPDLIGEDFFVMDHEDQEDLLATATIDIFYAEGFPAFEDGSAIWSQMPFEPDNAYRAFKAYLEQAERIGVRRIESLYRDPETQPAIDPAFNQRDLTELHTYYFWLPRCKAYDLFQLAAAQKLRERRVLSIQDQHFLESESLMTQVRKYFDMRDEDTGELLWIEELTPKVALDFLDKLIKIQRISVGLPAHGLANADENGVSKNASVEVTLRQIAKMGADPDSDKRKGVDAGLEMLLTDPETSKLAQELIIKVGAGSGGAGGFGDG